MFDAHSEAGPLRLTDHLGEPLGHRSGLRCRTEQQKTDGDSVSSSHPGVFFSFSHQQERGTEWWVALRWGQLKMSWDPTGRDSFPVDSGRVLWRMVLDLGVGEGAWRA